MIGAVVLACIGAAPALASNVAIFENSTYVDVGAGSVHEASNEAASLTALGHHVTTFTGITASDITAATTGVDTLVIPEQENKCLDADLSGDATQALFDWVQNGGQLVVNSDSNGSSPANSSVCDVSLLNDVFGWSLAGVAEDGTATKQAGATGTEFAGGPATLPDNNATTGLDDSTLPPSATELYHGTGTNSAVTLFRVGAGSVVDLGWDWYHSDPPNAGLQDGGWQSILNDAVSVPAASVSDVAVPEGNSGATNASFVVSLSQPASEDVRVAYGTADGTATAGSDYGARSGTVRFSPGETSKTVSVPVIGDTVPEPNETFSLVLSSPADAAIGDGTGTGTIVNDDAPLIVNAPDTTPPGLALAGVPKSMKLAKFKRGVRVSATPTEASALEFDLLGTARRATIASSSNLVLAIRTLKAASGKRTVTLKPSGKLLRNARKHFSVQLRVTATDASGNRKLVRRTIKVKR